MERRIAFLLTILLAAACSKPEEEEVAGLRTILPESYNITMETGGTVELGFRVIDADYVFNYTVGGASCQVRLVLPGGKAPEEIALKEVRTTSTKGTYIAVIEDLGGEDGYEVKASIAIAPFQNAESFVRSADITFKKKAVIKNAFDFTGTGLPVVYVDTENGRKIQNKTTWVPAIFRIQGTDTVTGMETVNCRRRQG